MGDHFPMFRLVTLLLRQVSSPIAQRIKTFCVAHPVFSKHVCGRLAWWYKNLEVRLRAFHLRMLGHPHLALKDVPHVPRISPEESRDIGSFLLGEIILYTILASIITFEYNRQALIKEQKNKDIDDAWKGLHKTLDELQHEVERQNAVILAARERLQILKEKPKGEKEKRKALPGEAEPGEESGEESTIKSKEDSKRSKPKKCLVVKHPECGCLRHRK